MWGGVRFTLWAAVTQLLCIGAPEAPKMTRKDAEVVQKTVSVDSDGKVTTVDITDGDVKEKHVGSPMYAGTEVVEFADDAHNGAWAQVEDRIAKKLTWVVQFYSSQGYCEKCSEKHKAFAEWAAEAPENQRFAAVDCKERPEICRLQVPEQALPFVGSNPYLMLFAPYDPVRLAPPEGFDGGDDEAGVDSWRNWVFMRLKILQSAYNRWEGLKMIKRESEDVVDVGEAADRVACIIWAARALAVRFALGNEASEDPIEMLWESGACADAAVTLHRSQQASWSKQQMSEGFKWLTGLAHDAMHVADQRWGGSGKYIFQEGDIQPSPEGMKILRLCVGLGQEAPLPIWAACLENESQEIANPGRKQAEGAKWFNPEEEL